MTIKAWVGFLLAACLTATTASTVTITSFSNATATSTIPDQSQITSAPQPPASDVAAISSWYATFNNVSYTGECWEQWVQYSSYLSRTSTTAILFPINTTYTTSVTVTNLGSITGSTIHTDVETETRVESNGAFPFTTWTSTETTIGTDGVRATSIVTEIFTVADPQSAIEATQNPTPTPPSCTVTGLIQSDCQASWDAYGSAFWAATPTLPLPSHAPSCISSTSLGPACSSSLSSYEASISSWNAAVSAANLTALPSCSYANVTGAFCSSAVSMYLFPSKTAETVFDRTVDKTVATQYAAPGCTVGCQQCRITGASVKLLYWPPQTASPGNKSAATIVTMGTTLTSPTVYISFDTLYASDSCSAVGTHYTDTIVPIPKSTDISSLVGWPGPDAGGYLLTYTTSSFNWNDLTSTPIPNTIYNLQPRCQSSSYWYSVDNDMASNGTFVCPRTRPYEPILSIPPAVFALDPAWKNCAGALEGVYDPPSALSAEPTVDLPGAPGVLSTAAPASSPASAVPSSTTPAHSSSSSAAKPPSSANNGGPSATGSSMASAADPTNVDTQNAPKIPNTGSSSVSAPAASPAGQSSSSAPADPTSGDTVVTSAQSQETQIKTQTTDPGQNAAGVIESMFGKSGSPVPTTTSQNMGEIILSALGAGLKSQSASKNDPGTSDPDPQTVADIGNGAAANNASPQTAANTGNTASSSIAESQTTVNSGNDGAPASSSSKATDITPNETAAPAPVANTGVVFTAGSQVLTAVQAQNPSAGIVIGSQTLQVGGPAATVGTQVVSAGSSGLVLSGSDGTANIIALTSIVQGPPVPSGSPSVTGVIVTIASHVYTASQNSDHAVVVGSQTLEVGGSPATIGTDIVSAASSGLAVGPSDATTFISYSNVPAATANAASGAGTQTFSVDGTTFTAITPAGDVSAVVVNGATVSQGGSATVIDSHTLSLGSSGLAIDGTTTIPASAATSRGAPVSQTITANGAVFSIVQDPSSSGYVVVDGSSISRGGSAAVVDSHTLSLGSSGLAVDGRTTVGLSTVTKASTESIGGTTATASASRSGSASDLEPSITSTGSGPASTTSSTAAAARGVLSPGVAWLLGSLLFWV